VVLISTYTSLASMATGVFIGIAVLDESWPTAPRMSLLRQASTHELPPFAPLNLPAQVSILLLSPPPRFRSLLSHFCSPYPLSLALALKLPSLPPLYPPVLLSAPVLGRTFSPRPPAPSPPQFSFLLLFWGVLTLNGHCLSASLSRPTRTAAAAAALPRPATSPRGTGPPYASSKPCSPGHKRHSSDSAPSAAQLQQLHSQLGSQLGVNKGQRKLAGREAGREASG
jgi:hypothetical protein